MKHLVACLRLGRHGAFADFFDTFPRSRDTGRDLYYNYQKPQRVWRHNENGLLASWLWPSMTLLQIDHIKRNGVRVKVNKQLHGLCFDSWNGDHCCNKARKIGTVRKKRPCKEKDVLQSTFAGKWVYCTVYRTVKFTCGNDFMFLKVFIRFKS